MPTYKILEANGYIVIDTGTHIAMLDTGCPCTIHDPRKIGAGTVRHVGQPVNEILGNDQLRGHYVLVDFRNREVSVSETPIQLEGVKIPFKPRGEGHWVLPAKVNGADKTVVFDTGAPISYVDTDWVRGQEPFATESDYSPDPAVGDFESKAYRVPMEFAGETFEAKLNVPSDVRVLDHYRRVGALGVIGGEIFTRFKILINFEKQEMVCAKY